MAVPGVAESAFCVTLLPLLLCVYSNIYTIIIYSEFALCLQSGLKTSSYGHTSETS